MSVAKRPVTAFYRSWPNALRTYDLNDRSRSRIGERQRRTWRKQARPPLRRCRRSRGGGRSGRTDDSGSGTCVRRLIRPPSKGELPQVGYFAPPTALTNASRSVTSFTSSTTSRIALASPSLRPFVHVVHALTAPSHKTTKQPRLDDAGAWPGLSGRGSQLIRSLVAAHVAEQERAGNSGGLLRFVPCARALGATRSIAAKEEPRRALELGPRVSRRKGLLHSVGRVWPGRDVGGPGGE